ncbi:unnamed protein product [Pleuronectes platessa]|uniref:Uncharacterized protein n=1 Tax=Pleuronectes platessa TaxID=8262 RepID=A0A9N7U9W9_PLEPL|nr:unnamed protein product [Pleuronectes platessa]
MACCERGVQTLVAIVGAFAAFSLMTIAIGTDYWLYSRAYICNTTNVSSDDNQMQPKKVRGDLTHSGLWRICCIEGKSTPAGTWTGLRLSGEQLAVVWKRDGALSTSPGAEISTTSPNRIFNLLSNRRLNTSMLDSSDAKSQP